MTKNYSKKEISIIKDYIEKEFKITLNKNNFLGVKDLYKTENGDAIYCFERELKSDSFFIITINNITYLYKINHNPNNYNAEINETGRFHDSFKLYLSGNDSFELITDVDILLNKLKEGKEVNNEEIKKEDMPMNESSTKPDALKAIDEPVNISREEAKKQIQIKLAEINILLANI